MNNRVEVLRDNIEGLALNNNQACTLYVKEHMYSVSNFAAMIAVKRELDPEIATMIGLLHDINTLLHGYQEKHALLGSVIAREILLELDIVSKEELETICTAVKYHSKKRKVHDEYSELAKDADVLSHYFDNVTLPVIEKDRLRLEALRVEFGF